MMITIKGRGGEDLNRIPLQLTHRHIPGVEFPVTGAITDGIKDFRQFLRDSGRADLRTVTSFIGMQI